MKTALRASCTPTFGAPLDKRDERRKSRRPEGRRLKVESGDDAPIFAGGFGVGCDRSGWREVEVTLERKPERAARGGELVQAHVAEFLLPEAEIAEAEGEIFAIRVQLRQEPGAVAVGGEDLDDGFEVDGKNDCTAGAIAARTFRLLRIRRAVNAKRLDRGLGVVRMAYI